MASRFQADLQRLLRRRRPAGLADTLRVLLNSHGVQALAVYRYGRWLGTLHGRWRPLRLFLHPGYRIAARLVRKAYGIDLDPGANIGPSLLIGHFGGIVVKGCRLGSHCTVQQQTVLAPATSGEAGPILGPRVWVGAHARIIGPVRVGAGATIGAGAVVTEDVPARCLILGNPGRIARRNYDNRDIH